jgi:hypothetical protein
MSSWRGNCPDCGGRNTLSISNEFGELKWFCFKAHCVTKGRYSVRRSVDEILTSMVGLSPTRNSTAFELPIHFTAIESNVTAARAAMYLKKINMDQFVYTKYDPKLNRLVYIITRGRGNVIDAIGSSLDRTPPKWYKYGKSGRSFIVTRKTNVCVIVEDIPSACVVGAAGYTSMALLGTNLTDLDVLDLMGYNVIVALDPDAHSKGIAMADRLSAYTDARAVLIPDDLKYFTPDEVRRILNHKTEENRNEMPIHT